MLKDVIYICRHEIRKWIRYRTRPKSIEEAEEKRLFWAKMYALTTLSLLAYTTYHVYHNTPYFNKSSNAPQGLDSSFIFTSNKPVRHVNLEGFGKITEIKYSTEELEKFIEKRPEKSSVTEDLANAD